jgi:hypothetical protein
MWILIGVIILFVLGAAFGASYEFLLTLPAFGVASLAVQSWRELGVLVATTTALYWPVKWLAGALAPGSSFTADSLTLLAIILAAVTMILWRHFAIVRAERRGESP